MLEALGNLGDFVGGIAVVATLLYLAVQIRQNTRSLQAAAQDAAHNHFARNQLAIAQDPGLADLIERAASDYSGLGGVEKRRFRAFFAQQVRSMEINFLKYEQRLLPGHNREGFERTVTYSFGRPGYQQCWNEMKPIYSLQFREFVDGIIARRAGSEPAA